MIPTGLMYSTDHATALLTAFEHLADHIDVSDETLDAENDLRNAREMFGRALWEMPTEGWDVQDVLASVKSRHDRMQAAMRRLSDLLANEGG